MKGTNQDAQENENPRAFERSRVREYRCPSQSNRTVFYAKQWGLSSGRHTRKSLPAGNANGANLLRIGRIGRAYLMAHLPKSKALELTYERASQLLTYCPTSGMVRWRISRAGCVAGEIVGTPSNGYLQVQIDLVFYRVHCVAWLLHFGRWPSMGLDHRNGKRADNRIANLREATPAIAAYAVGTQAAKLVCIQFLPAAFGVLK